MHFREVNKFCLNCNKKLFLNSNSDVKRKKFCSIVCRNTYSGKERYANNKDFYDKILKMANSPESNAKKGLKKELHPKWKGGDILKNCLICNKSFYTTNYKINSGNGKYCSRRCFEVWQSSGANKGKKLKERYKIKCKLCEKIFEVQPCKKDTAKYCSVVCHNIGNLIFCKKFRNTSIEIKLYKVLDDLNIVYNKHKQIKRLTVPDAFIEPNICIYADGDYWHSLPNVADRDFKINNELKECGYIIVRFSEFLINNNIDLVYASIKEVLNSVNKS